MVGARPKTTCSDEAPLTVRVTMGVPLLEGDALQSIQPKKPVPAYESCTVPQL